MAAKKPFHFKLQIGDQTVWEAWPIQDKVLQREETEILFGGARGGSKTACGIAWLLMGNVVEAGTAADGGYFKHPNYRALVLRKNVSDMGDWVTKAKQIYQRLGATYTVRPSEFRFPSGATIVIGHLDDENAYEHYQGQEFARILIEELTQIPTKDLYTKVMASLRVPPGFGMRRQIFLTANPGGPGHGWVKDRFIDVGPSGQPFTDPESKLTRIFVPAGIKDNPIYANDQQYMGQLMSLSPAMRRAWLEGDWAAIAGQYFEEFRLKPNEVLAEPASARHVWHSSEAQLKPWYNRWIACDWGYTHNAAIYKGCMEPNGRIHVYDEKVLTHATPEELGLAIGQFVWSDLKADGAARTISLYLSPDAFVMQDKEASIADAIASGIRKIVGNDACYVLNRDGTVSATESFGLQRSAAVAIQRASNQRVAGWLHIKSLLRWWPTAPPNDERFDPELALKLHTESQSKFLEYMAVFQRAEEVLPRLVIHGDRCPELIAAIPLARANAPDKGDPEDIDKKHFDGMDSLDALRYLLYSAKDIAVLEPFESFFAKRIAATIPGGDIAALDGNSRVWVARKAEQDYERLKGAQTAPIRYNVSSARATRRAHRKEFTQ
jgi:hypothetical protein